MKLLKTPYRDVTAPDFIATCNMIDVYAATHIQPQVKTKLTWLKCLFGFHLWGFSHCLFCGKPDEPMIRAGITAWTNYTPELREAVWKRAKELADEAGVDLTKFVWEQLTQP